MGVDPAGAQPAIDLGGGVTVTPFIVATWRTDASPLFGPVPKLLWGPAVGAEVDGEERLPMAGIALLIETPDTRVLVDPGPGEAPSAPVPAMVGFEASGLGTLEATLAGSPPLDAVGLTDLRAEHVGGLLRADGSFRFAARRIVAEDAEWKAALHPNERIASLVDQERIRRLAMDASVVRVAGPVALAPKVHLEPAGGFTTGHQVVLVRGRGRGARTFAWFGDLLPRRWHANPRWVTALDDLPLDSVSAKAELFGRAAADGWLTIPAHEPGAPLGRLVPDRDRYRFEPSTPG